MKARKPLSREPERRCLVTGQILPKEALIRFVLSPDGIIVPDITERLPGRGGWVTLSSRFVQQAIDKKLFHKHFKQLVIVQNDLVTLVARQLEQAFLSKLGFAKKAGQVVCGFDQVQIGLNKAQIGLLIRASDATSSLPERGLPLISFFDRTVLSSVLGRENAVHVAVRTGNFSQVLKQAWKRCEEYQKVIS